MKGIIAAILIVFASTAAGASPEYRTIEGIHYKSSDDDYIEQMCTLDISNAEGLSGMPVIVWLHGGGLTGGKASTPSALLKDGNVVVSVSYRLLPMVDVSEIIDDAAAALSWVFANIADYGGDPSRVYLAGHSAGAYLAYMVGLDRRWLDKYGEDPDRIEAIAAYSGQTITHYAERKTRGISPLKPVVDELAPLYHVRGDAPAMLITSGDRELEMYGRYEETAYFVRMLRLNGHTKVSFHELEGFNHSSMVGPSHMLLLEYIKKDGKER